MKIVKYFIAIISLIIIGLSIIIYLRSNVDTSTNNNSDNEFLEFPTSTSTNEHKPPFDSLLKSEPRPTFRTVLDNTHLDLYGFYPCDIGPEKETVVLFTAKYNNNNFTDAFEAVKDWEPYILKDVGPFIFKENITSKYSQLLHFNDMPVKSDGVWTDTIRQAQINIDGKMIFVNYGWLNNYVLFSASQACLESVMESIDPVH